MLSSRHKWHHAAIVCCVMAIGAGFACKAYAGQLMAVTARETARAVKGVATPSAEYTQQKERVLGKLRLAAIVETLFAALFLIFWLTSRWTRELARQVVPIVLLAMLILLQFLRV